MKENIILQSPQDISGYVVTVYAENLTACLLENREIEFVSSDNEVIFTMTSPYMYDSAGELSEDITVEMIQKGTGIYFICMTPDADWLADENRVYPITIDPQVSTSTVRENIIDNYVLKGSGNQNRNLDRLYIGTKSGATARAYIKFTNMPTLPSGSTITAATMTLHITANTSTGNTANAYMVNGDDWSSSTITWANMPTASGTLATGISHNNLTKYSFSCKAAVQTWYTGSTSGTNKNYGIMIRYSDETIADYNAVYSADHTTETQRPSISITYQAPSNTVSVLEGATYTLSSTGISGTITWSSNNTAVATVNSSGKVTAIKAGKATISASVSGVVQKTFTVYVIIANGVYYLKNVSVGFYLGTGGLIADNTTTQVLSKSTSGISQIRQLWKITYLGTGYYSIRPMHKLDMAVCLSSSNVVIRQTTAVDTSSDVPSTFKWSISYNTNGYVLKYLDSNGTVMQHADGASSPGLGVIIAPYSSTSTKYQWTLEKLSNPPSGVYLYDTSTGGVVISPKKYVAVEESQTLADYNLLPVSYSSSTNSQMFTWSVSGDNSIVTVNSSTGEVSGISAGTATIFGTGSAGTVQYSVQVLPLPDGTYYIRSWYSDKYVDIKNQEMASDTVIHQWEFHGGSTQQWFFTHVGDGVYSIHSANSTTKYYLGVSGDSSDNAQPVVLKNGDITNGMKWKVTVTPCGAYKIMPITGEAYNRVLALEASVLGNTTSNGDTLQQRDYVEDMNYKDEWLLCPVNSTPILEGQQMSVWCWVASARMASSSYMVSPISQASAAVQAQIGDRVLTPLDIDVDSSTYEGTIYHTKEALAFITGSENVYSATNKIYDETTLQSLLDNANPVILVRGWYAEGKRNGGHCVVVYDYYWDAQIQAYMYKILDPWPVSAGKSYSRSYSSICNGQNIVSATDISDRGIWESVVTFEIGSYLSTISWPGV